MKVSASLAVLVAAQSASAALYPGLSNLNHTCQLDNSNAVRSCSNGKEPSISSVDSCCAETFGGLFLATQFWDTYTGLESNGQLLPKDTWTIHGLWPDFCNGSYTQYCDLKRQYDPVPSPNTTNGLPNGTVVPAYTGPTVDTFLQKFGKLDLIAYMKKFWINQGAPNTDLWAHEFSKHATCFSTFQTECYGPSYQEHQDLVDYYESVILYYRRLPTWGWLAQAGIRPSNTTSYSLTAFQNALQKSYGAIPYLGCSGPRYNATDAGRGSNDTGFTVLTEVWYNFHVYGRPQQGAWVPVNATGSNSNCAKVANGIRYPERTLSSLQK